jgi:hypothetical protein
MAKNTGIERSKNNPIELGKFLDNNYRSTIVLTASGAPGKSSALGPIPTQPLIGIEL